MTPCKDYLLETPMLDFSNPDIQSLIARQGWQKLAEYDAIGAIYTYVRDDILFGYNADDRLSASQVLRDGYGQCNTKGTLLMALLRAVGIATRLHGFTIFNELQRGAIPEYLFVLAPKRIIHSWVEVYYEGRWINLEGYIIDRAYLNRVQQGLGEVQNGLGGQCAQFSGYGIATPCLANPEVDWRGKDTYIQREGIADDFGVYAQPDDFYGSQGSNLSGLRKVLYQYVFRYLINFNVNRIRAKGLHKPVNDAIA
ncbi:transglutaminase family protein [Aestuariirhabdus sp. Z084]|uniref:transglutaminase-like domain-containing protein n=1 Tax=Aestuariirhabdus haliotis TaxID=2918751 RepID=UPI00201B464C|nr:transglutaminase family protein [Aestuariirhabdus haliotis]MCL6417617.1 transglutaminase family protein [Aestuariirhabdus haliotis]MCL6421543.1 transglutaminase family protein [Aestuariirhabdus haliotis]